MSSASLLVEGIYVTVYYDRDDRVWVAYDEKDPACVAEGDTVAETLAAFTLNVQLRSDRGR